MVYAFDNYVQQIRNRGLIVKGQWHDEALLDILKTDQQRVCNILDECIKEVNNKLKLNIELSISKDIGLNYGDAH